MSKINPKRGEKYLMTYSFGGIHTYTTYIVETVMRRNIFGFLRPRVFLSDFPKDDNEAEYSFVQGMWLSNFRKNVVRKIS